MNNRHPNGPLAGLSRRPAGLRERDAFWQDFAARASLVPQTAAPSEAAAEAPTAWLVRPWAWAVALPAVALLLAALLFTRPTGSRQGSDRGGLQTYEIGAGVSHGGVIILTDEPSNATILWIVDLTEPV